MKRSNLAGAVNKQIEADSSKQRIWECRGPSIQTTFHMALRENTLHVFRIFKERINFCSVHLLSKQFELHSFRLNVTMQISLQRLSWLYVCLALCILPNPRISLYILRYIRVSLTMSFKTLSLPGRFPLIVSFESKTTNPPKRYSYIAAWILSILVAADLICANKIGKISCQAAYTGHCRQPRYLQIVSGAHSPSKSRPTSINQFTIHSLSIRILCHCPSLSIIVLFIPFHSYFIGNLLAKGNRQPWESSEHRLRWMHLSLPTASLVAPATEYRRRLDWHEKVSGLVPDTWNDPLLLLGCGSLKKAKILTSCELFQAEPGDFGPAQLSLDPPKATKKPPAKERTWMDHLHPQSRPETKPDLTRISEQKSKKNWGSLFPQKIQGENSKTKIYIPRHPNTSREDPLVFFWAVQIKIPSLEMFGCLGYVDVSKDPGF